MAWLTGTPFRSYLLPGLVLAATAAVLTGTVPQVGAWVSVLAGVVLTGQIAGEIRLLGQPVHWIEMVYLAAGALMMAAETVAGSATARDEETRPSRDSAGGGRARDQGGPGR